MWLGNASLVERKGEDLPEVGRGDGAGKPKLPAGTGIGLVSSLGTVLPCWDREA